MNFINLGLFLTLFTPPTHCYGKETIHSCFTNALITPQTVSNSIQKTRPQFLNYEVIAQYPHDTSAFTQGLVFYKQNLFESTGLLNQSEVRKINLKNGKVILKSQLPDVYFGEGLSLINHQLVQMSWKTGKVFFFHPDTLLLKKKLSLNKEVWGSTYINHQLVISDGSSHLFFLNPNDLIIQKTLKITFNNQEITGLNELEYAENYIYANVWPTHCIVKIDPNNGKVVRTLNLSNLYPEKYLLSNSTVLNGIAFNSKTKHFFITGKFWPYLYEIKLQSNEN